MLRQLDCFSTTAPLMDSEGEGLRMAFLGHVGVSERNSRAADGATWLALKTREARRRRELRCIVRSISITCACCRLDVLGRGGPAADEVR